MKSVMITTLLMVAGFGYAQEEDIEQIGKIIETGNAKELVKTFNGSVALNIDGDEATYSRSQAEAVLKDFFSKNPPKSFAVNHKGASKGGLPYAIGRYEHGSGNYRVWIRLKKVQDRFRVIEMSFIKE